MSIATVRALRAAASSARPGITGVLGPREIPARRIASALGPSRFQSTDRASSCPHASAAVGKPQKYRHSTLASDAAAAGCPVHGGAGLQADGPVEPELVNVPSLPFAGSLIAAYSGIPKMGKAYDFWPQMREKYGDFYSMGLPGLGDANDPKHTLYVIQSPTEMHKVLRSEGSFPSGMAQNQWALFKWEKEQGFEIVNHADGGFPGQGENWKRIRGFMQTDLFHPTAAKGYMEGIIEAAELASRGAPSSASGLNSFLERAAFDMFSVVMFGELMGVADPNTPTEEEDLKFVDAAKVGLGTANSMTRSLKEILLVKKFGMETEDYVKMKTALDVSWEIGNIKIERFLEARDNGALTDLQKNSYLHRAMERYESGNSGVSLREAKEMVWGGIFAAVDTTSGKMGWNLVQAAVHPEAQEQLFREISAASNGGKLTADALDKRSAPYLHAFIRETHRLTPVSPIATRKCVASDDMTVHGVKLPRGSAVACDGYSLGQDPKIVDEPRSFRPERWFPDAVAARKGTPQEVLDHTFFKDPFSQGPRKCPGSRVALNEVAVLLAQLVMDYKITAPTCSSLDDIEYQQVTVNEPIIPTLSFEPR
mmetsp:Transcript_21117/g.61412  ORF Transcript_21117/g.61412 Transcript_21117/m.61412 type:complete len:595 (-) Transcript_21117:380-2164(-)